MDSSVRHAENFAAKPSAAKPSAAASASSVLERITLMLGGALVFLSIAWPRYGFFSFGGSIKATPFTAVATAMWVVLPLILAGSRSVRARVFSAFRGSPVSISLLLFWFSWRLICSALGEQPEYSLTIVLREVIYFTPLFILAVAAMSRPEGMRFMIGAIISATIVVLIVGLSEIATGKSIAVLLGVNFAGDQLYIQQTTSNIIRGGMSRTKSVFSHPIVLGQFLCYSAPIILLHLFKGGAGRRSLSFVLLVVASFIIVNTGSRAAILGFVVCLAATLALLSARSTMRGSRAGVLLMIVLCLGGFVMALAAQDAISQLVAGRSATEAGSTQYRLAMLDKGLSALSAHPLMGFGEGRAPFQAGFHGVENRLTIDSYYLSALLDSGAIGLALLLAFWLNTLSSLMRIAIRGPIEACGLCAGFLSILAIFTILSINDNVSLVLISSAAAIGLRSQSAKEALAVVKRVAGAAR